MPSAPRNPDGTTRENGAHRILVVDDDPDVLRVLTAMLRNAGYETLEAHDGDEAWRIVSDVELDLIITDIGMPGRSGDELLSMLCDDKPSIPVILITGMATLDAAVAAIKCGAFDYIAKPIEPERLFRTVISAIEFRENEPDTRPFPRLDAVGDFRVIRFLGEGSSGLVYLVKRRDDPDSSRYAMKLLKLNALAAGERERTCERFMHEARAVATISHPNVIRFVDYGITAEGAPYLIMEFFPHPSLAYAMPLLAPFCHTDKVRIIVQIAEALSAIHAQGICHRDIKPANIMVDTKTRALKISDFGIAKIPGTRLTASSSILGSPAYMAPEGFSTADVDHRADIFSLGVLSYELLLGHRPFPGETVPELMRQVSSMRPVEPRRQDRSFPLDLELILGKMLRKKLPFRYASADHLLTDLAAFLAERRPPYAKPRFWRRLNQPVTSVWS